MPLFRFIIIIAFTLASCRQPDRLVSEYSESGKTVQITESLPYENFESYRGVLTQTPWPSEGGWQVSPYGNIVDAGLDRIVKSDGNWALRMTYRLGESDMIGLSRVYTPCLKWEGYDAVQLWLRPDGSGRNFTFFVMEKIHEDGIKWFWESAYAMTGTKPVILTIPFSTFYLENNTKGKDAKKPFDWSEVEETCFWVRRGKGDRNPEVPSTIWVDNVKVVKLAQPLDKVIAEPATPPPPKNREGIIRIDYGSEANWTDAEGRIWMADIPAREGKLVVSRDSPVTGTTLPDLYRNQRQKVQSFSIPVNPGHYNVVLHFVESDPAGAFKGKRIFSVDIEGHMLKNIDIWSESGGTNVALVRSVLVDVKDSDLSLTFIPVKGFTVIAALEVLPPGIEPAGIISWKEDTALVAEKIDLPDRNIIENFESYSCDKELCSITQPLPDGMMPTLGLDPGSRCDGLKGLRFDYVFGKYPVCGFMLKRRIPVTGYRGIRFWIRPDGSDNKFNVYLRGRLSGSYAFNMTDITPRYQEISWKEFFKTRQLPDFLDTIGISIEKSSPIANGTVFLDRFELIAQ
jgi:hypothetical protein